MTGGNDGPDMKCGRSGGWPTTDAAPPDAMMSTPIDDHQSDAWVTVRVTDAATAASWISTSSAALPPFWFCRTRSVWLFAVMHEDIAATLNTMLPLDDDTVTDGMPLELLAVTGVPHPLAPE